MKTFNNDTDTDDDDDIIIIIIIFPSWGVYQPRSKNNKKNKMKGKRRNEEGRR